MQAEAGFHAQPAAPPPLHAPCEAHRVPPVWMELQAVRALCVAQAEQPITLDVCSHQVS